MESLDFLTLKQLIPFTECAFRTWKLALLCTLLAMATGCRYSVRGPARKRLCRLTPSCCPQMLRELSVPSLLYRTGDLRPDRQGQKPGKKGPALLTPGARWSELRKKDSSARTGRVWIAFLVGPCARSTPRCGLRIASPARSQTLRSPASAVHPGSPVPVVRRNGRHARLPGPRTLFAGSKQQTVDRSTQPSHPARIHHAMAWSHTLGYGRRPRRWTQRAGSRNTPPRQRLADVLNRLSREHAAGSKAAVTWSPSQGQ